MSAQANRVYPCLTRGFAAIATAAYASGVCAVDADTPDFSFNGFGTLGVIHSDYDQADFVTSSYFRPSGVGHTRSWGTDQDSKLGLQVSAALGDRLTAVIQVVTQQRYDNTFEPSVEWANLRYAITPDLSIRVGRVVLPTFLSSDTQYVGYVNPWVRTPAEILIQLPITNSDGADISYQFNVGAVSNRLQILYGNNSSRVLFDSTFKNTGIWTVTDTLEYGDVMIHLGYQKMQYSYDLESVAHPQQLVFEGYDAGFSYDPGGWYVTGEQFNSHDSGVGRTQAWYLGGGYRFGKFTPYLVFSKLRQTATGTYDIYPFFNQKTSAAGMRWDFLKNFAAKLQYERITIGSAVLPASFVNMQPGFSAGDRADVFSATIDFVW